MICLFCLERFISLFDLTDHLYKHLDKLSYICSSCTLAKASMGSKLVNLLPHFLNILDATSNMKALMFCNKCFKTFPNLNYLLSHYDDHLKTMNFDCGACSLKFMNKKILQDHFHVTTALPCKQCGIKNFDWRLMSPFIINSTATTTSSGQRLGSFYWTAFKFPFKPVSTLNGNTSLDEVEVLFESISEGTTPKNSKPLKNSRNAQDCQFKNNTNILLENGTPKMRKKKKSEKLIEDIYPFLDNPELFNLHSCPDVRTAKSMNKVTKMSNNSKGQSNKKQPIPVPVEAQFFSNSTVQRMPKGSNVSSTKPRPTSVKVKSMPIFVELQHDSTATVQPLSKSRIVSSSTPKRSPGEAKTSMHQNTNSIGSKTVQPQNLDIAENATTLPAKIMSNSKRILAQDMFPDPLKSCTLEELHTVTSKKKMAMITEEAESMTETQHVSNSSSKAKTLSAKSVLTPSKKQVVGLSVIKQQSQTPNVFLAKSKALECIVKKISVPQELKNANSTNNQTSKSPKLRTSPRKRNPVLNPKELQQENNSTIHPSASVAITSPGSGKSAPVLCLDHSTVELKSNPPLNVSSTFTKNVIEFNNLSDLNCRVEMYKSLMSVSASNSKGKNSTGKVNLSKLKELTENCTSALLKKKRMKSSIQKTFNILSTSLQQNTKKANKVHKKGEAKKQHQVDVEDLKQRAIRIKQMLALKKPSPQEQDHLAKKVSPKFPTTCISNLNGLNVSDNVHFVLEQNSASSSTASINSFPHQLQKKPESLLSAGQICNLQLSQHCIINSDRAAINLCKAKKGDMESKDSSGSSSDKHSKTNKEGVKNSETKLNSSIISNSDTDFTVSSIVKNSLDSSGPLITKPVPKDALKAKKRDKETKNSSVSSSDKHSKTNKEGVKNSGTKSNSSIISNGDIDFTVSSIIKKSLDSSGLLITKPVQKDALKAKKGDMESKESSVSSSDKHSKTNKEGVKNSETKLNSPIISNSDIDLTVSSTVKNTLDSSGPLITKPVPKDALKSADNISINDNSKYSSITKPCTVVVERLPDVLQGFHSNRTVFNLQKHSEIKEAHNCLKSRKRNLSIEDQSKIKPITKKLNLVEPEDACIQNISSNEQNSMANPKKKSKVMPINCEPILTDPNMQAINRISPISKTQCVTNFYNSPEPIQLFASMNRESDQPISVDKQKSKNKLKKRYHVSQQSITNTFVQDMKVNKRKPSKKLKLSKSLSNESTIIEIPKKTFAAMDSRTKLHYFRRKIAGIKEILAEYSQELNPSKPIVKEVRVLLHKLPDDIFEKHVKQKPIMLSCILPKITQVVSLSEKT